MAYNFTVQRQLFKDFSVTAGYVGNQGRHVFVGNGPNVDVNTPAFIPGVADTNLRRPYYAKYGWTQGIDFYCNCANNRYDSFQLQAEKRYSAGFTTQISYTYQLAQGDSGDSYTFLYNRPLGYGNQEGINKQQFTWAANYEIPFGRNRKFGKNMNRGLDYALGGWNLNGVTVVYSGRPFTPNADIPGARPNAGPGGRPNVGTADPYAGARGDRSQWYVGCPNGIANCATFGKPADNTFGNYPINSLYGPKYINQDLSIAKNFAVTERSRFSLRAEAFNVFNHTNLGDPDTNVTSGNAGVITGLAPGALMRRLQFALRLDF